MSIRPIARVFRHGWIYLLGLLLAVLVMFIFFDLNPSTEVPPP